MAHCKHVLTCLGNASVIKKCLKCSKCSKEVPGMFASSRQKLPSLPVLPTQSEFILPTIGKRPSVSFQNSNKQIQNNIFNQQLKVNKQKNVEFVFWMSLFTAFFIESMTFSYMEETEWIIIKNVVRSWSIYKSEKFEPFNITSLKHNYCLFYNLRLVLS